MKRTVRSASRVLMLLLLINSMAGVAPGRSPLRRAADVIAKIRNYEFVVTETKSAKNGAGRTVRYRVRQAGDLYRTDVFFDPARSEPTMIFAHDGKRFQNFDKNIDALSFSGKNRLPMPYGMPNPLTLPYYWLFADLEFTWTDLTMAATWSDVIEGANHSVDAVSGEQGESTVVRINGLRDVGPLSLRYGQTSKAFPAHVSFEESDRSVACSDFTRAQLQSGSAFIPTKILLDDAGTQYTYAIDPESLRVNHKIERSVFTLSPSMASVVDDFDQNMKRLRESGKLPPAPEEPPASSLFWFYILGLACIAGTAAFSWFSRRRA